MSFSLLRDTATKHSPSNDKSKGSEIPQQVLIVVNYGDQEGRNVPMASSKGEEPTDDPCVVHSQYLWKEATITMGQKRGRDTSEQPSPSVGEHQDIINGHMLPTGQRYPPTIVNM